MKKASLGRTLLAGVAGGLALNVAMLLTFRLLGFGWNGGGPLLDPDRQSPKLIAVWTQLEPLPLVVANPAPVIVGLVLFGVAHAFIYRWLSASWPVGIVGRGWRSSIFCWRSTAITRPWSPTILAMAMEQNPIPQPISITVIPGLTYGARILSGLWSSRRNGLSMK